MGCKPNTKHDGRSGTNTVNNLYMSFVIS